jgi:fucose permease
VFVLLDKNFISNTSAKGTKGSYLLTSLSIFSSLLFPTIFIPTYCFWRHEHAQAHVEQ